MACFYTVAPFHSVCEPPDIVKKAFKEVTGEKEVMDAAGLVKFMRTVQGDGSVTEGQAKKVMEEFISYSWEKNSSLSMRVLGLRSGSHSSRSLRRGLLAREVPETGEPPTFTSRAFLKFLLNPRFNGHRRPVSKTVYPL